MKHPVYYVYMLQHKSPNEGIDYKYLAFINKNVFALNAAKQCIIEFHHNSWCNNDGVT